MKIATWVSTQLNADPSFFERYSLRVTEVSAGMVKGRIERRLRERRAVGPLSRARPSGGLVIATGVRARVEQLLDQVIAQQDAENERIHATSVARQVAHEATVSQR